MNKETHYHFLSSLRQGLAASINQPLTTERAEVQLDIHPARRIKATGEWGSNLDSLKGRVQLYGPGDIVTFEERMVVRREPQPNSGNFEPNYFPAIEFADPDFPWRFTPEPMAAGGSSMPAQVVALTPWITLIVLVAEDRGNTVRREFEDLPRGSNQRPAIRVFDQANLPDLKYAWRWAHVQATTGDSTLGGVEKVKELMTKQPECVVSRLLCTRRLKPKTLYRAMVVPTYKAGWATALDTPEAHSKSKGVSSIDFTWDKASRESIDLPYFDSWEFRTSKCGDFEFLARLLEPRVLEGLELRDIDCGRPGYGLTVARTVEGEKTSLLVMEGARQSLDTEYTRWGKDKIGPAIENEPPPPVLNNDGNYNGEQASKEEVLFLIVWGDLLKRYPAAIVYAVDAFVPIGTNEVMPMLPEYNDGNAADPIFPIFKGTLGKNLVFLGFPFSEASARIEKNASGTITKTGKFFVFEERVSEAHFGLGLVKNSTVPPDPLTDWSSLNWGHFGLAEAEHAGEFLDASNTVITHSNGEKWAEATDAALRARITFQEPARLSVHADHLMPKLGGNIEGG